MGIPYLYTHLRPYARPESFPPAGGRITPLYIDGPGLAHHVYHLALCSTRLAASNPWESALAYRDFQEAVVLYLDLLEAASFSICKIYLDGHLPITKRPTRLSRLNDSLRKLKNYHSLHPRALHSSAAKQHREKLDVFSATATYTPRTAPLSAPPFIVAAMIEILSAHPTYSASVSTVPGEAESYCARDAISAGGIVLTGDSDLLLFSSPSETDWGVMMFKDVEIAFLGPSVSAVVFRPTAMAKSLGVDLTFLGFLTLCDGHASFGALQQRAVRIAERKKSGAAVEEYGKRWRGFAAAYVLPPPCDLDSTLKGVEPRIAEIIQQREEKDGGEKTKTMFLPSLWEDPTRGSAWDAGRRIRAVAYSLLFPSCDGVEEVCRRGQRIAVGLVERVEEDPIDLIKGLVQDKGEKWWTGVVLDEIMTVFEHRGQKPPEEKILQGAACMVFGSAPSPGTGPAHAAGKWTWERIQIYAMAQAAWYSLLLFKEVMSVTFPSSSSYMGEEKDWQRAVKSLPGVAGCIDGNRFLDGITLCGEEQKRIVTSVKSAYDERLEAAREEEEGAMAAARIEVDINSSSSNGNSKRPIESEPWMEKERGKKKKRGGKGEGRGGNSSDGGRKKLKDKKRTNSGNMFAALTE